MLTIDDNSDIKDPCMFERGTYFSVFYCLYYIKYITMGTFEEKDSEERDSDLNEEEDIIMEYSRE